MSVPRREYLSNDVKVENGLPVCGRYKLFREVHRDGQLVPLDRHLHVLHVIPPSESK